MSSYIGIDLGTTFSAVAFIDDAGRPSIIHNDDGVNVTPSVVEVAGEEQFSVGESARKGLGLNPNCKGLFKRDMNNPTAEYQINGQTFTPHMLSAIVLKKLAQTATTTIGDIGSAVVTIPANFANEGRDATLRAAKEAGLNVEHIVNEPTAAALYYAYKSGEELSGTYAVYDLGGGTFDISIINVEGKNVEVLAANGVSRLGGDDFDKALCNLVKQKFKAQTGEDLDDADFTKNDAEEEKKSLSKREKIVCRVAKQMIEITREEFEVAISSYISQAQMVCEAVTDEVNLRPDQLKGVFLVGGSTRIPAVLESVRKTFNQEPVSTANVDEVVALGAAIYAAYKSDRSGLNAVQKKAVEKIQVDERTAMCFGTLIFNGASGGLINDVIIPKNEKVPCTVTRTYTTISDGQESIDITITESRAVETDPTFVKKIKEGNLDLPSGRPAGQEIKVEYSFDANQIMNCSFTDVATDRNTTFAIAHTQSHEVSSNEIDKFMVE